MQPRRLVAGARDVFGVAAAVLVDALGRQLQHAVGQRGEEVPVVRDEQHGAFVVATAPRSASPSSPCRGGWSARRAPGSSADRRASAP